MTAALFTTLSNYVAPEKHPDLSQWQQLQALIPQTRFTIIRTLSFGCALVSITAMVCALAAEIFASGSFILLAAVLISAIGWRILEQPARLSYSISDLVDDIKPMTEKEKETLQNERSHKVYLADYHYTKAYPIEIYNVTCCIYARLLPIQKWMLG
jgi:hypothetical protein